MEIKINKTNRFNFYPDVQNNLDLPEKDRFCIVVKKLNTTMHYGKWSTPGDDGKTNVDMGKYYKEHIVELINAPTINIDGKEKRALTADDFLGDEMKELFFIGEDLAKFIEELLKDKADGKKS